MSLAEKTAHEVLVALMNPDNRVAKEMINGRSVAWRQMILRQLKKWDVADYINASQLKVNPKYRAEESN